MKGDFSRDTYHPSSQYSRVLMQQGRVQLDADWNEQTSILLGYMRALTRDLFGPAAGPAADCGFRIVTDASVKDLPKEVADQVKAELAKDKEIGDDDLLIMPGRYYVGGLPVELGRAIRYRAQTGFPFGEAKVDSLRQQSWLAYLDVWEDFVSADQDPYIRDVALNGLETCGRGVIRWQVRLMLDPKRRDTVDFVQPTGSSRIKVRANPSEDSDALCSIAPDARYRGAENQLYRIEIHTGGTADAKGTGATYKWSRDNGAVAFPVVAGTGNNLTLAHLGRDEATTLIEGDWVELVDDFAIAAAGAGVLAQVAEVDRDTLRVDLALPDGSPALRSYTAAQAEAAHALLRRWDHRGTLTQVGGAIPVAEGVGAEAELEDGIKVVFEEGGEYRAGDYWMFPARVATGDVEWPGTPDKPDFQRPDGPQHYYAPLAVHIPSPAGSVELKDLRCCIAPLRCAVADKRKLDAPAEDATGAVKTDTAPVAGKPK